MTYYILLAVGFLLMWAKTIDSATRRPDFDLRYFIRMNWFKFAFGIASAVICGYSLDYFFNIMGSLLSYFVAFGVGWFCSSFVNEFLKVFRPKVKF